ncbi:LacI family DNA-binding transcriptional regulator [Arthrobacter sp. H5]|uniref:LacI family DNA-binding transcriptional regulator n=1 Tax=Arthrobacter sp. H5 TaxID=1267973 RepID=UPI0004843CB2|nr:LacI family DNA-binding transcriptional regulator [Arthrobacter sp. H5]
MAVTISDVARAAGVSKGAVSYALNGQTGVSDETRRRILSTAKDLGWTPSLRARSLSSSKAYALGLVVARNPKLLGTDPFFPSFIAGIETTLADQGFSLVLTVAARQGAEEASYRRLVHEGRVDGVILSDMRAEDSRIPLLLELGLPAVTLNRPSTPSPFPAVCMDDTEGISNAVQHLIDLGHTRIAHVGGPQHYVHSRSRRDAWADTLERSGLEAELFIEADFGAQQGTDATARLIDMDRKPTAIVYANDIMATAGQSYLQQQGLSIPDDISVTGYDNTEFAQYLNPALTSIGSDPLLWGSTAAQVLLNQLGGKHDGDDVILPAPQLIIRGSTAKPPANPSK